MSYILSVVMLGMVILGGIILTVRQNDAKLNAVMLIIIILPVAMLTSFF